MDEVQAFETLPDNEVPRAEALSRSLEEHPVRDPPLSQDTPPMYIYRCNKQIGYAFVQKILRERAGQSDVGIVL